MCALFDWEEGQEGRKQLWVIPIPGLDKEGVINRSRLAPSPPHRQHSWCRGLEVDTRLPKPGAQWGQLHLAQACWVLAIGTQLCNVGGRRRERTCQIQAFSLHRSDSAVIESGPWYIESGPRFYQMPPRQKGCQSCWHTWWVSFRDITRFLSFLSKNRIWPHLLGCPCTKGRDPRKSRRRWVKDRGSRGFSGTWVASVGYTLPWVDDFFFFHIVLKIKTKQQTYNKIDHF